MDGSTGPKKLANPNWVKFKNDRRNQEQALRHQKKMEREELKKLAARAAAEGKVLVRRKKKPFRKYAKVPGGRAAARNEERSRPATGNRRPHHRKWLQATGELVVANQRAKGVLA